MYPNAIIGQIDLYQILIYIGIICCFIVFRVYFTKQENSAKVFNFYLCLSAGAIIVGFFFASIFQSFFNYIETGVWDGLSGGITFYGGLVGGIVAFVALLFAVGPIFFKNKEHLKAFHTMLSVAPCSVTIAHAFGRIGCLFAGCCHGKVTEGFGIRMYVAELGGYYKCVPTQLYEAIFLFVLFVVLSVLYFKKFHYEVETYCISYGVWRFIIEFFRDDDRGSSIVPWLTPSQGFAILFIAFGLALLSYKLIKKYHNHNFNDNINEV